IRALGILHMNGSPSQQYNTMGDVFKKDGFISSPLEEQGRFIYALQQQIEKMISQIDGVIDVECQVSLAPSTDNLWQNDQVKPAAAVFIKYKNGYRLDLYVNRIKQLVANSVPGLSPDRVEVLTMTPVVDK
ncbi:MAG: EscJ/YscJ/HrcJ family type III secretion inner membrane ring protein, partial [Burkholderiales bacterium]|nr:EscJ/YscJ/HrcJ family type III secretion inner membrane ring protein [Burkholderiales bacterium]